MKWDYITIVEISGQDHLPYDSVERALHQYASSQAIFNTLQVVFWKCSPKVSDLTGYSVLLLLFAAFFFFFTCHAFQTNTLQVFPVLTHLRKGSPSFFSAQLGFVWLHLKRT